MLIRKRHHRLIAAILGIGLLPTFTSRAEMNTGYDFHTYTVNGVESSADESTVFSELADWTGRDLRGQYLQLLTGPGEGVRFVIVANLVNTLTVQPLPGTPTVEIQAEATYRLFEEPQFHPDSPVGSVDSIWARIPVDTESLDPYRVEMKLNDRYVTPDLKHLFDGLAFVQYKPSTPLPEAVYDVEITLYRTNRIPMKFAWFFDLDISPSAGMATELFPSPNQLDAAPDSTLSARLITELALTDATLKVNGVEVPVEVQLGGTNTLLTYAPEAPYPTGSVQHIELEFIEGGFLKTETNWTFVVKPEELRVDGLKREGQKWRLRWSGGAPPYIVKQSSIFPPPEESGWRDILTTTNTDVLISIAGNPAVALFKLADARTTLLLNASFDPNSHYDDLGKTLTNAPPSDLEPLHTRIPKGTVMTTVRTNDAVLGNPENTNIFSAPFPPRIYGEDLDSYGPGKRPLIFIPGFMGSMLETLPTDGTLPIQVWPPFHTADDGSFTAGSITELITAKKKPSGLVPFVYDGLLRCLRSIGYMENESLFIFPYNWTEKNEISGRRLAGFIQEVIVYWNANHPENQVQSVDVINHSMGGIVTRTAAIYFGAPIERTIYIASPHYGSPKAYFFLKKDIPISVVSDNWFLEKFAKIVLDKVADIDLDKLKEELRRTVLNLQPAYELLPDRFLFDKTVHLVQIDDGGLRSRCSPTGPILGGWPTTYIGNQFSRLGDEIVRTQEAMSFKEQLGPDLPGKINLILFSETHDTLDKFGLDLDLTMRMNCVLNGGGTEKYNAAGDATVTKLSALGPGPGISSVGDHSGIPNSAATCYFIKRFLVESSQ